MCAVSCDHLHHATPTAVVMADRDVRRSKRLEGGISERLIVHRVGQVLNLSTPLSLSKCMNPDLWVDRLICLVYND